MFDDFYFEDKYHPWDVKSLEEFRNYCCPECPAKYVNKTDFIKHAVSAHPQSQSDIGSPHLPSYIDLAKAWIRTRLL